MNFILIAILGLLALYIGHFCLRELTSYTRVQKYKKSGLKHVQYVFWPMAFLEIQKRFKTKDPYKKQKEKIEEFSEKEPFYVVGAKGTCTFTLLSDKAIAEFYKKETKYTVKHNNFITLKFLGFFWENGKKVEQGRATFSKIFHYSNIVSLMPQVAKIIRDHVAALRARVEQSQAKRLKIDLKEEFLLSLFEDLTGAILLTGADKTIRATFEGKSISQLLKEMFHCFEMHPRNLMNKIPFVEQLGLSKEINEFKKLQNGFKGIIEKQYKQRYNSTTEENLADNSILDIMVKLNKKAERETGKPQFTIEEISSNFEIFQFAASDTSFQVSCSATTYLAQTENKRYQDALAKEIKTALGGASSIEEVDNDELSSLAQLDMVFRETMRMANPAIQIARRRVVKDFQICGHRLKRGDFIRHLLVGYQPGYFKQPFEFRPERFEETARKVIPHMKQTPFSHGQRGCIGKYLGEMIVKLILVELVGKLRFEVEEGFEVEWGMNPIYGVANPNLVVSLRD